MRLDKNQNGSSLVGALAVMVAAAGLSALMIQTSDRDSDASVDFVYSTQNFYRAESAMEMAKGKLKKYCEENGTSGVFVGCPASFSATGLSVGYTQNPDNESCRVEVVVSPLEQVGGQEVQAKRTFVLDKMQCELANPLPPTWQAGVTACASADVSGSSTLSYNSAKKEGTVASGASVVVLQDGGFITKTGSGTINGDLVLPGSGAYVTLAGSASINGSILITGAKGAKGYLQSSGSGTVYGNVKAPGNVTLSGSCTIKGNIELGGTVSKSGSAKVLGTTTTVTNWVPTLAGGCDPFGVDALIAAARPAAETNLGDFKKSGSGDTTWSPGTYFYNSFKISGSGNLVLPKVGENGKYTLFVDGPFQISGSGKLLLATGVTLNVYHTGGSDHTGGFSISGSGVVNPTSGYGQMRVYSNSTGVFSVSGSGDLAAAVYAPKSPIKLSGSGNFYGAGHGKTFDITGSGDLMYDRYLGETDLNDNQVLVVQSGWREIF